MDTSMALSNLAAPHLPERKDWGGGLGGVSFTLVFLYRCGLARCVSITHPISWHLGIVHAQVLVVRPCPLLTDLLVRLLTSFFNDPLVLALSSNLEP